MCKRYDEGFPDLFRIKFDVLFELVKAGRKVDYAFLCGSIPPESDIIWQKFRDLGIKVATQQRARDGGEVAVDQEIQLRMANRILDAENPGTMVLLSGDGKIDAHGDGFIKSLERAKKQGWDVEVWSWDISCSRRLRSFAETHGLYSSLDKHYEEITYMQEAKVAAAVGWR